MANEKIKQLVVFLFLGFQNYFFQMLYLVPKLIEMGFQNAYLVPLYFVILSLIIFLFIPKIKKDIVKRVLKNYFVKIPLIIYLFLMSFFLLYLGTIVLSEYIFDNSMYYVFLISLIIISLFLSYLGIRSIFHVYSFFSIIGLFLMVLPLMLVYPITDFSMLLPSYLPPFKLFYLFISLFLTLDSTLIYLITVFTEKGILKKTVIWGNIFSFILLALAILLVISIYGDKYYVDFPFIALSLYEIQESFKYVGNVDFVLCYILPIFTVFKVAYYLFLIRILLKIKKKKTFVSSLFIVYLFVFIVLFYAVQEMSFSIFNYVYYAFILLIPYYILLLVRRRKSEA